MSTTMAPPRTERLLASWSQTGRTDLEAHASVYGPLRLPTGDLRAWQARHVAEIEASGLTGRGGAGFPAWRKLASARSAMRQGRDAIVVLNAMEGEPASFKDRILLERAPHLVLDGAELTAMSIGAAKVVVCVSDALDEAAESVLEATAQRRARGLNQVLTEIARPPAGFIAGEESALASWLAGGPPAPSFRQEKSVPLGVKRSTILVHNAETLAHVSLIARHGSRWFKSLGTATSPGTTLVSVSGAVEHPGVLEIALGTPLSEIVGGAKPVGKTAALIVGGYGGSVLGSDLSDAPFSTEGLAPFGASPGAGVIVVLPHDSCGVAETANIAAYLAAQSSGQCGPCALGLPAIAATLRHLAEGHAATGELTLLRRRMSQVAGRGGCRHPDGAVRLVSSALNVFESDFETHASGHICKNAFRPSVLPFERRTGRSNKRR
jgi:NADH:ubiquinone oxidoreductase subunit F (NADH-binding)